MTQTALINGGGIGGLAAAIALARAGWRVIVAERTRSFSEIGAGVQLSPNACHALARLGVDQALMADGVRPAAAQMRHFRRGWRFTDAPLKGHCEDTYGAPYLHILRADLHRELAAETWRQGVEIRLGAAGAGYRIRGDRVELLLEGGALEGDVLIGADGVRSTLRAQMLGPDAPRFTGNVAWRALLPMDAALEALVPPNATVWVGPEKHVVTYRVGGGTQVNIVAVEERSQWRDESWSTEGSPDAMRAAFAGWHGDVTGLLDRVTACYLWALYDRPAADRWTEGPVALLGDASHPMPPFAAQGAAMAIEDADALGRALTPGCDIPAALRAYQDARLDRVTRVHNQALGNGRMFHMKGMGAWVKLIGAALLPGAAALKPQDWIFRYNPGK